MAQVNLKDATGFEANNQQNLFPMHKSGRDYHFYVTGCC